MAQNLLAEGNVGPAGAESGLPPFSWIATGSTFKGVSHVGQPDTFAYSFELLRPSTLQAYKLQKAALQLSAM